jgi:hypothetical protein
VANVQNLKPGEYKFTHDDQIAGGIASGKARHERATMRKTLEAMLKQKNEQTGNTFEEDITLGIITGAMFGKAENYKIIAQMTGALESEEQTGTPQVNINIVDNSELEKVLYEDENE